MDGLLGNIQIDPIQPVAQVEVASKKSKKRSKSVRVVDDDDASPVVKKRKLTAIAVLEPTKELSALSRKSQCMHLNAFCSEFQSPELNEQYTALGYKYFAKCEITDFSKLLSQFLPLYLSGWELEKAQLTEKGAPLLLFVSSSAVRSLELVREAREGLGQNCIVAKLFAKHMKIEKQRKFLSSHVCHIATGTPERLLQIIAKHNYISSSLKLVVLDWQRKDAKQRRLIDISENREPLSFLLRQYIIPLMLTCQTKLFLL